MDLYLEQKAHPHVKEGPRANQCSSLGQKTTAGPNQQAFAGIHIYRSPEALILSHLKKN